MDRCQFKKVSKMLSNFIIIIGQSQILKST